MILPLADTYALLFYERFFALEPEVRPLFPDDMAAQRQKLMETLALIAYKQPVSKPELEEIRGVNCDYALQKLLEKELVFITGRSEGPGRPLLYGTTEKFMDYLGINSLTDLPKPKDFKDEENSVGEVPALEE